MTEKVFKIFRVEKGDRWLRLGVQTFPFQSLEDTIIKVTICDDREETVDVEWKHLSRVAEYLVRKEAVSEPHVTIPLPVRISPFMGFSSEGPVEFKRMTVNISYNLDVGIEVNGNSIFLSYKTAYALGEFVLNV